jgi:hypothetical protein
LISTSRLLEKIPAEVYVPGVVSGVRDPPAVLLYGLKVTRTDTDQLVQVFLTVSVTLNGKSLIAAPPSPIARLTPQTQEPISCGHAGWFGAAASAIEKKRLPIQSDNLFGCNVTRAGAAVNVRYRN